MRVPKPLVRGSTRTTIATSWCSKTSSLRDAASRHATTPTSSPASSTSSSSSPCCTRAYWETPRFAPDGDLAWIAPKGTGRGDGGATFVQMAVDDLRRPPARRVPPARRAVSPALTRHPAAVPRRRAHARARRPASREPLRRRRRRTGFLDWAVIARAPGIRDVAYVLCNSIPTEIRRAHERELVATYCDLLARSGITLDGRRRVGAVPDLQRVRLGRGDVHGRHGIEVATRAHRTRRHDACHDRRRRPRLCSSCWRHDSVRSPSLRLTPPKELHMSLYDTPIATLDGNPGALEGQKGNVTLDGERRLVLRPDAAVHGTRSACSRSTPTRASR